MATGDYYDPSDIPNGPGPAQPPAPNWWEGPPPAGYTGAWPPPLPAGASYGPNLGQIVYPTNGAGVPTTPYTPRPTDDPGTTPTPTPTPPPPTTDPGGGNLTAPFTGTFTAPTPTAAPTLPTFTPPTFTAPTATDALNSPGYQFRLQQGENSLQNWAAARGTLNDSGTAKALLDYGQNAGSQEYQNVWNRDFNKFGSDYKGWSDSVLGPGLLDYSTQYAGNQHANDMGYANAWNQFLSGWDMFRDQRDSTFNKRMSVATA